MSISCGFCHDIISLIYTYTWYVRFGPKWVRLAPNSEPKVLNSDLKKSRICPVCGQSDIPDLDSWTGCQVDRKSCQIWQIFWKFLVCIFWFTEQKYTDHLNLKSTRLIIFSNWHCFEPIWQHRCRHGHIWQICLISPIQTPDVTSDTHTCQIQAQIRPFVHQMGQNREFSGPKCTEN